MRLTTWNVNSIRLRLDNLRRLVEAHDPDVICLQETKVRDDLFPFLEVRALGFPHVFAHGQDGYNGVAVLSKLPLATPVTHDWGDVGHARHAHVVLPDGLEVHNVYVPAGGDVPDPALNPKFAHKLDFLDRLTAHLAAEKAATPGRRMILVGDLNVSPLENDVWSHKQLLSVVCHTPVEVAAFARLAAAHDLVDAMRRFVPEDQKLYTWWSYRNRDWTKANRGRRLDHVLVTPALADGLTRTEVLSDARSWPMPSDHVPVTVTFDP